MTSNFRLILRISSGSRISLFESKISMVSQWSSKPEVRGLNCRVMHEFKDMIARQAYRIRYMLIELCQISNNVKIS